jgi:hypothetical protein
MSRKLLSSTQKISHIDTIKAIKSQMSDFRETLFEVLEKDFNISGKTSLKS